MFSFGLILMDFLVNSFYFVLDVIYWIYDFVTNGRNLWIKIPFYFLLSFLIYTFIYLPYKEYKEEKEYSRRFYHCDTCNRDDALVYTSSKELERYKGHTEVRETLASGKRRTRQVKCIKVVEQNTYTCKYCGACYTTKRTKTLK